MPKLYQLLQLKSRVAQIAKIIIYDMPLLQLRVRVGLG
jgi:hypothetical protein